MRSIKEMDKRLDERDQEIERQKEVIHGLLLGEYFFETNVSNLYILKYIIDVSNYL